MRPMRREAPMRRDLPSGKTVWLARYTGPDGKRRYWKPVWNRRSATFVLKRDAQAAIDEAYERVYGIGVAAVTIGSYFETWIERHPRSDRTNGTNGPRIRNTLDVEIEGQPFRSWAIADLRRRQVNALVTELLVGQGRSAGGAAGILRSLSAMTEDAITDEVADLNPFKGVRVKASDPRARKPARQPQVWTFEQMHAFAEAALLPRLGKHGDPLERDAAAAAREARAGQMRQVMIRAVTDTGLRLGEVLALRRADFDGEQLHSRGNAHKGVITDGDTETKKHVRTVPCPPGLAALIKARPPRIDTPLLFPTPTGRVWCERNFYRDVWDPARAASGLDITPHECRHSYVSLLRAAGIDDADLATVAGHTVQTMIGRYTHGLDRSHDAIREAIG
jgi:integrase